MALLHGGASLRPTKLELLTAWIPTQPWSGAANGVTLTLLGSYRFDDPDGEVGIETHLLLAGAGRTLQVPLTYRNAPLAGAEAWLAGTMEHTVLGPRWVYDACGDPVYAAALARTILAGGTQAELLRELDGSTSTVEPTTRVEGSGRDADLGDVGLVDVRDEGELTVIVTSVAELVVRRVIAPGSSIIGEHELIGTWPGSDDPTVLAVARRR